MLVFLDVVGDFDVVGGVGCCYECCVGDGDCVGVVGCCFDVVDWFVGCGCCDVYVDLVVQCGDVGVQLDGYVVVMQDVGWFFGWGC